MICKRCGQAERYKDGRCAPCTRASNQRWKAQNRERHKAGSRRWDKENPDAARARARRWGRRNREKVAAVGRRWRQENPDRHCAHEHSRRARKRSDGGNYTSAEWAALCDFYGHTCLCCRVTGILLTVDHVVPLSGGGTNNIENIQPLCGHCNSTKATRTIDYRTDWPAYLTQQKAVA